MTGEIPAHARAELARGRKLLESFDFDGAECCLRRALALDPQLSGAYELLGKLLYRDGREPEAAATYRAWLDRIPSDPVAAHLVAATGGAPAPQRAADAFIASIFGRAAPEYDAVLANLGYCAPQAVFERATGLFDRGKAALDVLDLGCGTGLCGERLRPLARRLVGVDLSSEMLEQTRKRGCYDELVRAELTAYADDCTERFDLITAADVFCYFGDLLVVFAAVARLLRPGSWLIFSVEELDESLTQIQEAAVPTSTGGAAGYALLQHGRYAHSAEFVSLALSSAGLTPAPAHRGVLRFERGAPVDGLIVMARCFAPDGQHPGTLAKSAAPCAQPSAGGA